MHDEFIPTFLLIKRGKFLEKTFIGVFLLSNNNMCLLHILYGTDNDFSNACTICVY